MDFEYLIANGGAPDKEQQPAAEETAPTGPAFGQVPSKYDGLPAEVVGELYQPKQFIDEDKRAEAAASHAEAMASLQQQESAPATEINYTERGQQVVDNAKEAFQSMVEKGKAGFSALKSKLGSLFQRKTAVSASLSKAALGTIGAIASPREAFLDSKKAVVEGVQKGVNASVEAATKVGEKAQWKVYEAVGSMKEKLRVARADKEFDAKYSRQIANLQAAFDSMVDGSYLHAQRVRASQEYLATGDPQPVIDCEAMVTANMSRFREATMNNIAELRQMREEYRKGGGERATGFENQSQEPASNPEQVAA